MSVTFSCVEDFKESLSEVRIILARAKKFQKYPREYNICIKSALLFLVAKFEVFLEDLVFEYIQMIEHQGLSPEHFPEILKLYSLDKLVSDTFVLDVRKHRSRALQTVNKISKLCVGNEIIDSIDIDKSFNYGKHGEKEIIHLFSRIGIENIFSLCDIYEMQETVSGRTRIKINLVADINSITAHRNNILHNDITPNITHDQISLYKKHLTQFSSKIKKILNQKLEYFVTTHC